MGLLVGWHCADCGSGEDFCGGSGMSSLNDPDVVKASRDGRLGPAMRRLLGNGIPRGWTVFSENVFYGCPNCGAVIPGEALRIDDGSDGRLSYYVRPGACVACGEELVFPSQVAPMGEGELLARCEGYVRDGCPSCGGSNVTVVRGCWD